MAVFITGDCHGEWSKILYNGFITSDDHVIVCGDFGLWHDIENEESRKLSRLSDKGVKILWCDGNHENFDRLYSDEFEVVDLYGGKAHKIRENIYHLMRGYVFEIEGKKFFVFGGASSHDIRDGIISREDYESDEEFYNVIYRMRKNRRQFRIKGLSWWERELPTEEEMERGRQNLKTHNNEVDFVISHCLPQQAATVFSRGGYKPDILTSYFDEIVADNKFTKWYCGHYHNDVTIMGKFIVTYDYFERVV